MTIEIELYKLAAIVVMSVLATWAIFRATRDNSTKY